MNRVRIVGVLVFLAVAWVGIGSAASPYADMSDTLGTTTAIPVRGRVVKEKRPVDLAAATPRGEIRQREIENASVDLVVLDADGGDLLGLGQVRANEEGYVDTVLAVDPGRLFPGRYVIEVRRKGSTIGRLRAHLLGEDDRGIVIRSDVDMTYLNTDFEGTRAKWDLLGQNARERETLPGMAVVYRALRTGADGDADRPLVFISGSPLFFKRTIEAKLELDGIVHDGVALKPFKSIAWDAKTEPWNISSKLEEQVGYKLHRLLRGRLEMPPGMSEILLGDDTEADPAVFALYQRFTSRQLSAEALLARLGEMEVERDWLDRIGPLLPRVLAHLDNPSPVKAVYLHRTDDADSGGEAEDWTVTGVTVHHSGAEQLVRDLVDKGLVPRDAVDEVDAADPH
jgi:hypothetical protein